MNENSTSSDKRPNITIKYIFSHTTDMLGTRQFYSELIGLKETAFSLEGGFICFQCDGFELMFFAKEQHSPTIPTEWASQPGYEGGSLEITSWAIDVPEKEYVSVVKRLKESETRLFKDAPEWRQHSYWGFTVMDPNGVTVEVFTIPKEKPIQIEWIDT